MSQPPARFPLPDTAESRARWLHDIGGLSVEEIGWRLGVPMEKVRALLALDAAHRIKPPSGLEGAQPMRRLRRRLTELYGLSGVILAPLGPDERDPILAIGAAASRYVARLIQMRGAPRVVGVSYGRTIMATVSQLPEMRPSNLRFVSLLGELTVANTVAPYLVLHVLSQRLGAEAFPFPAALYAPSVAERQDLMHQRVIANVMDMARSAELWIVGIGTVAADNQLHCSGMIDAADMPGVMAQGAACEILGRFFDAEGREVATDLAARVMAPEVADFRGRRVIALAGGAEKRDAIRAALASGLVQELVIDSRTAVTLLPQDEQSEFGAFLADARPPALP